MEERKFTVCGLATDQVALELVAMKSQDIGMLSQIGVKSADEFLEDDIAQELDDIYEFCVITEEGDQDYPLMLRQKSTKVYYRRTLKTLNQVQDNTSPQDH